LDGVLPAPRGVPQIEVTFDIDANGILNVKALDKGTGKEQKITITASSGLSKEEVEKMSKEAEAHAAEDARHREEVEARNTADALVYNAEKILREQADKIPQEVKTEVEGKVAAVRSVLQSGDVDSLKSAIQELSEAVQKIGASVYQQEQQAPPPPPGDEPPSDGGDDTVEGDFKEV
ncbi:MAG: Hsp70 family protein, partial [Dehalococcoidia bacterium]